MIEFKIGSSPFFAEFVKVMQGQGLGVCGDQQ